MSGQTNNLKMNHWKRILPLAGFLLACLVSHAQTNISRIEYFIDTDPGQGKANAVSFTPGPVVDITENIDLNSFSDGFHWLYFRAKDADDKWSHIVNRLIYKGIISVLPPEQPDIARIEYFIDTDPGLGKANSITFLPGKEVNITQVFDLTGLTDGFHRINIRAKDTNGSWSNIVDRLFYKGIVSSSAPSEANITMVEYFIDTDPGYGKGTAIPISPGITVNINTEIDLSSFSDGLHRISIRARNSEEKWSHIADRLVYKGTVVPENPVLYEISQVEYFVDNDPGFGKGTIIPVTPDISADINTEIDLSSFSDGLHRISIRAKNSEGKWSHIADRLVYKGIVSPYTPALSDISRVEYFIDDDPGKGKGIPFTITPGTNVPVEAVIDAGTYPDGFHWFYTRSIDVKGNWSHPCGRLFYKGPGITPPPTLNIKRIEYFFDIDPGVGKASSIPFNESPDVTTESVLNISTLTVGEHYFAVRVQDSEGKWSYLSTRSFTTDVSAPAAPLNTSVTSGDRRAILKWDRNTEPDFLKYRIYCGNVSGSEVVIDSAISGIADTTITITDLTNEINYSFYITAVDSALLESTPGERVSATPSAPEGLPAYPVAKKATGILQNSFIANWSLCSTATGYRIDVAANPTFTSILPLYNDRNIGDTSHFEVIGLNLNTQYYYRIRAYNNDGTNPISSNVIAVTTLLNPPPPPTPPIAVSSTLPDQYGFMANWRQSESATGYKLDVSTDNDFSTYVADYNKKDVSYSTSYPVSGLTPDKTYYYRIFAYNIYGTSSASNIISAKTASGQVNVPSAPAAIAGSNLSKFNFTANWSSSAGATGYYLDVATDYEFNYIVTGYNRKDVGIATTYTVSGLNPDTDYYYRVYAYNADGTSSPSGTIHVKTLLNIPETPTGLSARSCDDLVTLRWRVSPDPDFGSYIIYGGPMPDPVSEIGVNSAGASDTTRIISGLTRGQTYYFRIKTKNIEGNESEFSAGVSVVVYRGVNPGIVMKWGDVLICPNVGDSIQKYQWYKDGTIIPGADKQYYVTNKIPGSYQVYITDSKGCEEMSSVKNVGGKNVLNIYPNPARTNISIMINDDNNERALVRIYNSLGMKMMEKYFEIVSGGSINEIPVSGLDEGVYYLEIIIHNEKVNYSKIVVTK
ncbi:MAG: fibronectin type III domain-containing protein [Bacteroidales bacterium]|nr:fibronectin type III domain-containing protein [Bacteroidales bacterium]